jgi:hypothetical protein
VRKKFCPLNNGLNPVLKQENKRASDQISWI